MLVKDLPKDIYNVAIKHHIKQYGGDPISKDLKLDNAFAWSNTPEGIIWDAVNKGNFKPFRKFHHNQLKAGDTVEYFKTITQEDWSEFGIQSVNCPFKTGDKLKIEHVSSDSNCTIMFENHHRHFPSHCFRKVEVVEEPVKESIEDFKVGDKVVFYREPTSSDWENIGETDIEFKIGKEFIIKGVYHQTKALIFHGLSTFYPASCFRKVTTEKAKVLNPIHQHYEDGGKIREKGWYEELYISKHGDNLRTKKIIRDYDKYPDKWEIFVEEDDKLTSKKIISVSETTLSEVPEYWYFPLDSCTDDELDKFQRFKEDKASFYKDTTIRKSHILLNFHWDKSYYYTDRVEELITETWFHLSAVQLKKEEFCRLIYNPWQDKQSKSGKIIEKIEPSSAHAVTETDEIIITSLKRKSKLRLLSTNVENLDVKLTTLKPKKQKV